MQTTILSDCSMEIAPQIIQLVQRIKDGEDIKKRLMPQEGDTVIGVDHIGAQMAHFYEKMRYSVDDKEEHLLRRGAIERMLKRRVMESFRKGQIATFLVQELIRAGYLPNHKLPERIVPDVERIIQKNLTLYKLLVGHNAEILGTSPRFTRVMSLAATEIEEFLFPPVSAHAAADALYLSVRDRIDVKDAPEMHHDELYTQIYIASYRSLLHYDEDSLFYRLWMLYQPKWHAYGPADPAVHDLAVHFKALEQEINAQLHHPLNWRLMPKLRDDAIYFSLIKESIEQKPALWQGATLDLGAIKKHLSTLLSQKYAQEKSLIKKSVTRVVIYILLTKIILAFILELPYDLLVHGVVNRLALGVNIVFHPLLLLLVTRVVRLPRNDSRRQTIQSIIAIICNKPLPRISVWIERKKNLFGIILALMYLFFFALIFGAILWVLRALAFNLVSSALFLLFLTLVSYFGLRIRNRAKRWRVTPQQTTVRGFVTDLLVLPIVQAGQWITKRFQKINVIVFFMDFVVETPFKILIQIFDGFTHYLREKKEEME